MAGTNPAFDASAFRAAIREAMTMGLPQDTAQRATFGWLALKDFSKADSDNEPFIWTASPTDSDAPDPIAVTCAVEFFSKGGDTQATRIGEFDVSRAVLTILDEEWETVLDNGNGRVPDRIQIDDAEYKVLFVGPPIGLFEVTVYQVYSQAMDEV